MKKCLIPIFIIFVSAFLSNKVFSVTIIAPATTTNDTLRISKDGKLLTLFNTHEYDSTKFPVELSGFQMQQKAQKRELLTDIFLRLTATIDSLERHRTTYDLLFSVDSLKKRYNNVAKEIDSVLNEVSLPDTIVFKMTDMVLLAEVLNRVLSDTVSKDINVLEDNYEINLYRPLYANLFFSNYYKSVFALKQNSLYRGLRERTYYGLLQSFEKELNLLSEFIESRNEVSANKAADSLRRHTLFDLFSEPWLKDLLWLNKGEPNLNPFDPSSQVVLLLHKNLKSDSIYLQYLKSQVDRKLANDNSGKYDEFKLLLDEWRKYDSGEIKKEKNDSLVLVQRSKFETLKTGFAFVNKIKIPFEEEDVRVETVKRRLFASSIQKDIGDFRDLGFLNTREKKIRWLVHNVSEDEKIALQLSQKAGLEIQGAWERNIANSISHAVDVYSLLNPYGAVLNSVQKSVKRSISQTVNIPSYDKLSQLYNSMTIQDKTEFAKALTNSLNDAPSSLEGPDELQPELKLEGPFELLPELKEIQKTGSIYLDILKRSSLPPTPWELKKEEKPLMQTKVINQEITGDLVEYRYKIQAITKKDTVNLDVVKFKRGRYTRFNISAGLVQTFGDHSVQHLSKDAAGNISFTSTSLDISGIAAVNAYPFMGGMRRPDDNFAAGDRKASRVFGQFGVGIPKPLDNIFVGVGFNFGPGLLLSTGLHLYSVKKYDIRNNNIISDKRVYSPSYYISLSIDPALLVSALGLFGGGTK